METNEMETICGQCFDQERALYGKQDILVRDCAFEGPADGESAFKEGRNIQVENSFFDLRYPFWHDWNLKITDCELTENCRAALWYSNRITIRRSKLHGIKALRECGDVTMEDCDVISPEFGWSVEGLVMEDCTAESEYFLMRSAGLRLKNLRMRGKYSFQYTQNVTVRHLDLDTKDAFWHSRNVTLRDCDVRGEYLGWYSENLTLIGCRISGTQPFCYCRNLKLIDCTMEGTDLAFEYSDVDAKVKGHVESVKNPRSGRIHAGSIGRVVLEDQVMECSCEIVTDD